MNTPGADPEDPDEYKAENVFWVPLRKAVAVRVNESHEAMILERGLELLMQVQQRVFDSLIPRKIVELFKLGEKETPPGIQCRQVVEGLFSFLGFTRLLSVEVIQIDRSRNP